MQYFSDCACTFQNEERKLQNCDVDYLLTPKTILTCCLFENYSKAKPQEYESLEHRGTTAFHH